MSANFQSARSSTLGENRHTLQIPLSSSLLLLSKAPEPALNNRQNSHTRLAGQAPAASGIAQSNSQCCSSHLPSALGPALQQHSILCLCKALSKICTAQWNLHTCCDRCFLPSRSILSETCTAPDSLEGIRRETGSFIGHFYSSSM